MIPQLAHEPIRTEIRYGSLSQGALGLVRGGPLSTTVVICTMFKNEGLYLEEWLQYHLLLGISKVSALSNLRMDRANVGMVFWPIPTIFFLWLADRRHGCR